jgi:hypothetical protein
MNETGYPSTLVASHPGNRNRELHGAYSVRRQLDPRAAEIAEALLEAAPHAIPVDRAPWAGRAALARRRAAVLPQEPRLAGQRVCFGAQLEWLSTKAVSSSLGRTRISASSRTRTAGYEWIPPADYRVAEVRPLRDAGQVGETVGGPRSRRKDNLLIRGDAVSGLRSLIRLISSITQRS